MARGRTTTNRGAFPWSSVVSHADIRLKSSSGYTRELTLSCGHKLYRKASQGLPDRVRCTLCPIGSKG
jgi:hypothetical protein